MEFNPDLTSLQALPLDQGLFALRRPTPAPTPGDDSPSFREHLETPRGRTNQDGPDDAPVKAGTETRRDRPENPNRTTAKRSGDARKVATDDRTPSDDAAPLDDSQSAPPSADDHADPPSTDSLPVANDAPADKLDDAKTDDASKIITEATAITIAAAAAPIELENSVVDVTSSDAPAVEPVAEVAPSASILPKQTADASPLPAATTDASPQKTVEAAAATTQAPKSTEKPEEPKPTETPPETNESAVRGVAEPHAEKQDDSRENEKTSATAETNLGATSDQTTAPVSETEPSSNDDKDRPRKGTAKITVSSSEPNTPTIEPATSREAPLHQATNNNAPPGFAVPATTVAAAAEKVAASASQSAGTRGVGSVESAAPQRLPQHLVGKPGEAPAGEVKLTEAEQVRILQRVARAFQTAQQREGEIRIRLSPPELGALKLEIKVQNGVMSARVEAETQAAQSLLVDNLPALRERLAEQNIRLENFEVGLQGRQSQGQQDNRDSPAEGSGSRPFLGGREREAGASADAPLAASRHHDGKLNVFI